MLVSLGRVCDAEDMNSQIIDSLLKLEECLRSKTAITITADGRWVDGLPARGGVYVIWQRDKSEDQESKVAVYVGETCHLKHRLSDLVHGKHRFRRKLAANLGIEPARLGEALARHYCLSFVTDILGRKELEEFLTVRWLKKTPGRLRCCDNFDQIRNACLI